MKPNNDQPDSNNRNRRSTLKTLLVGGGTLTLSALPAQWVKPVVDAVVLPAHAQTTAPDAPNGFNVPLIALQREAPSLLDRIIPKAYASIPIPPPPGMLCIERDGSGWTASYDTGSFVYTASGNFGNNCVPLECGQSRIGALAVTEANEDGSFDFAIFPPFGCQLPFIEDVTNVPCSLLESGACPKPE